MRKPIVSVLLPTYNGERFIGRAIASVLGQSFQDCELIVIDDGSTDHTADVVNGFVRKDRRVVFVRNKANVGIQKALNVGLHMARGEYIARIDDDDEWIDAGKLAAQVQFLSERPDYVLVGTGAIVVDENRSELFRFLEPLNDAAIRERLLFKNCFMHSAVVFRTAAALGFGGYSEDERVRHIEDYDLWLKLGTAGKLANLPTYSIAFMQRAGAITSRHKPEQFRKIIQLIRSFKADYPHFRAALLFAHTRSLLFVLNRFIPVSLRNWVIKRYKNI